MGKPEVVAGLDMGSGRVTCAVGVADPDTRAVTVLSGASVACRGIKGGVVLDIPETARAVAKAVEEAEAAASKEVLRVALGVRGGHLQSFNSRGKYNIARTDKQITTEDVAAVIQNAKAVGMSDDREFLHVLPQSFELDGQRGVPNPVGMSSALLEVEVHIITASSSHLNNLVKSVADAGFEVVEPVYGLLAAGELLVTPEERELGSLMVDFGGQSTSIGIFAEGAIKFSKDLPVGSDFITRDLAVGLHTSFAAAEKIKLEHGLAHPKLLNGDAEITFPGVDGRAMHRIRTSALLEFILPRVEQVFSVVSEEVANSSFSDLAVPGTVLTGGGCLLKGLDAAAGAILNTDVRLGIPHSHPHLAGAPEELLVPRYATAIGLLLYPFGPWGFASGWGGPGGPARRRPAWMRKLRSVIDEIL